MRSGLVVFGLVAALALAACLAAGEPRTNSVDAFDSPRLDVAPVVNAADDDDDDGDEVLVRSDQIPEAVKAAAIAALPGFQIEEAELEEGGGIYCVHGTVDGRFHEVEVSADGASAHVEEDDGDDEGERDDD